MESRPEYSTDDELLQGITTTPSPVIKKLPRSWHFWNVKSEEEHARLKAKRKAEKLARRKNRRR